MIADNLRSVRLRIAKACDKYGRPAGDVHLVCVTKEATAGQIREAIAAGATIIGENRVQDAVLKHREIGAAAAWHLVGHLQTNKVKDAVRIFSLIHSVDSLRLAEAIDKEAAKIGKVQDVLIQVNTSGEESKFGVTAEQLMGLVQKITATCPNISIHGMMTIAPDAADAEGARACFRELRELRDSVNAILGRNYMVLSMGMTGDFEAAIAEGATMVRIGRAIFGADPRV